MMHSEVMGRRIDWYAVRVKPPRNPGRRTVVLGAEYDAYRNRAGQSCHRRKPGTGRREHLPKLLLERAGFEVFLPLRKEWRRVNRISREKHLVTLPMLADWLFVGWQSGCPRWADLMALDLVVGALGTNGRPALISEARMMKLMRRWGGGRLAPEQQRWMRTHAEFGVGDRVRVAVGPLEGFEMKVVEVDGPTAKGVVDMLGKKTEFGMPADLLEPVW